MGKGMSDYTIYCTEKQTRLALKLGAPLITIEPEEESIYIDSFLLIDNKIYAYPTAEQMIGWLRKEKGLYVEPYLNGECCYSFSPIVSTKDDGEIIRLKAEDDPEWATLCAISAALEYLENE